MSANVTRTIECDRRGCAEVALVRPGETNADARARLARDGWTSSRGRHWLDNCPAHDARKIVGPR